MIEKLKSLTLILLVCLSLFLTYQLWYGQKPAEEVTEAVYERLVVERPRPLEDIVAAKAIIVNRQGILYYLQESDPAYRYIWPELSTMLQGAEFAPYPENVGAVNTEEPCIRLLFDPPLPIGDGKPWFSNAQSDKVFEMHVACREDNSWLRLIKTNQDEDVLLSLPEAAIEELYATLTALELDSNNASRALNAEEASLLLGREIVIKGSVYVPVEPVYMDTLVLEPEDLDQELILKTFFINPNLVRTIEERDGSLLYTDGERGLRLIGHSLEYSHPFLEEGQASLSYIEALTSCSTFLSYHGGWPAGLRLVNLTTASRGRNTYFQAQWRMYLQGYPVYSKRLVSAIFNDRGLVNYSRSVYRLLQPLSDSEEDEEVIREPLSDWPDALHAAAVFHQQGRPEHGGAISIDALHLGYAVTGDSFSVTGIPIWLVTLNGSRYMLRADNLALIDEEELK